MLQPAPQEVPAGEFDSLPEPDPLVFTVKLKLGIGAKVAVTLVAAVPMVIVQLLPLGDGQLVQPLKVDAEENGVAVRITVLPLSKLAEQVPLLQLMPAGALLTVPAKLPFSVRLTLTAYLAGMKLALTACAVLIVTVQVPTPLQPPPLQPANSEAVEEGVAVRTTVAPEV